MSVSQPSNASELLLYRILQKANLLPYFQAFVSQGGDDVQQLCESGEGEFMEIMSLVDMASKPLHVRRLQKVLHDYCVNPEQYVNLLPKSTPQIIDPIPSGFTTYSPFTKSSMPSIANSEFASTTTDLTRNNTLVSSSLPFEYDVKTYKDSLIFPNNSTSPFPKFQTSFMHYQDVMSASKESLPILSQAKVKNIEKTVDNIVKSLPEITPNPLSSRKSINLEIMKLIKNPDITSEEWQNGVKKCSKIFGRCDSKRSAVKPITYHELSVNLATNFLCLKVPALLACRAKLFALARKAVKDSGYVYARNHSRSRNGRSSALQLKPGECHFEIKKNMKIRAVKR